MKGMKRPITTGKNSLHADLQVQHPIQRLPLSTNTGSIGTHTNVTLFFRHSWKVREAAKHQLHAKWVTTVSTCFVEAAILHQPSSTIPMKLKPVSSVSIKPPHQNWDSYENY